MIFLLLPWVYSIYMIMHFHGCKEQKPQVSQSRGYFSSHHKRSGSQQPRLVPLTNDLAGQGPRCIHTLCYVLVFFILVLWIQDGSCISSSQEEVERTKGRILFYHSFVWWWKFWSPLVVFLQPEWLSVTLIFFYLILPFMCRFLVHPECALYMTGDRNPNLFSWKELVFSEPISR